MNVITCYKIVQDDQDIIVRDDRTLELGKAELEIGQYDLPAIEAGMQVVADAGGKVSALSVGPKLLENSKLKKAVLSRGPADLYLVVDDSLADADTHQTARTLAAAIQKIGNIDLVLCGEGSSDLYSQQVGAQLGELLGMANINAVSKITVEGDKLIVERTLEDEVEVLEVSLPAVISVTTDIVQPRIPSMKEVLSAGKKPVTQWSLADIGLADNPQTIETIDTLAPELAERKQIVIEGDSEDAVNELWENLRQELQ